MADLDPVLAQLADAFSIATEYWDWRDNHVEVPAHTIVAVLAGLGVDASTPEAASAALHDHHEQPWRRMLPPFLALRERRTASVWVHVPHGDPVDDLDRPRVRWSTRRAAPAGELDPAPRGGRHLAGEASFEVPDDLPLGYHTLHARSGHRSAAMPLIITPQWLGFPERMGARRGWGLATQLYSVRSRQSWGIGDLADLEDLAVWSAAEQRADFVLVNPLHAAEPVAPMEPSPYLPTSRRFANPIYLRVERIPEYAVATPKQRAKIIKRCTGLKVELANAIKIDRDRSWTAKRKALKTVFKVPRTPGREASFRAYCAREGQGLTDFATWAALAEVARSPLSRVARGASAPGLRGGVRVRSRAPRPRSTSTAGCSGCSTSSSRRPSRPVCAPGWRWG